MSYFKALERSEKRKAEEKKFHNEDGEYVLKVVQAPEKQTDEHFEKLRQEELRKQEARRKQVEASGKPLIIICIPNKGTFLNRFVTHTLIPLIQPTPETWCEKGLITFPGYNLDIQRNKLAYAALEYGATHILFMDDDMLFEGITPMQAMKMLFDMDVPIASGIARLKREGFPYAMYKEHPPNSGKYRIPEEPITDPDLVGMFCCLIKKQVFEKVPKPWFESGWDGKDETSEDSNFCLAAAKAGFKVRVNPDVKLEHMGVFGINNNLEVRTYPTG